MKLPNVVDVFVRKTKNMILEDIVVVFAYMFSRLLYRLYDKSILNEQDIDWIMMDE